MTHLLDHKRQAGYYIRYAGELLDSISSEVIKDPQRLTTFKDALTKLAENFFKDPSHFMFSPEDIQRYLEARIWKKADDDEEFPNLKDFVELLLGKNENFPFPREVFNDHLNRYESLLDEDINTIQTRLFNGTKIKINSLLTELENPEQYKKNLDKDSRSTKALRKEFEDKERFIIKAKTKEGCLELVSENGLLVANLSEFFKDDRDIALQAVTNTWKALEYLNPRLLEDPEIALVSLNQSTEAFKFLGEVFSSQKEKVLSLIEEKQTLESLTTKKPTHCITLVASLLRSNQLFWDDLPDELKSETAIGFATVDAVGGVGSRELIDLDFPWTRLLNILARIVTCSSNFQLSPEDLSPEEKDFNKLIMSLVSQDGSKLCFASERIRAFERDIIFKAIENSRHADNYVLEPTKSYIQDTKEKIRENPDYYLTLDDRSQDFYGFALEAISKKPSLLKDLPPRLKAFKSLVLQAVDLNPDVIKFADEHLQLDRDFLETALKRNGLLLKDLPEFVRQDKGCVLIAVEQNGLALEFASPHLKKDWEVVLKAVKNNGLALKFANLSSVDYKNWIEKVAIAQNGLALKFASKTTQDNEKFVNLAISQNESAIWYASFNVRKQLATPIRNFR